MTEAKCIQLLGKMLPSLFPLSLSWNSRGQRSHACLRNVPTATYAFTQARQFGFCKMKCSFNPSGAPAVQSLPASCGIHTHKTQTHHLLPKCLPNNMFFSTWCCHMSKQFLVHIAIIWQLRKCCIALLIVPLDYEVVELLLGNTTGITLFQAHPLTQSVHHIWEYSMTGHYYVCKSFSVFQGKKLLSYNFQQGCIDHQGKRTCNSHIHNVNSKIHIWLLDIPFLNIIA